MKTLKNFRHIYLLAAFLVALSSGAYASNENSCQARVDFLKTSIATAEPLTMFANAIATKGADVNLLAIGETHNSSGHQVEYGNIIRELKNHFPKPFCVFQEMPMFPDESGHMTWDFNYLVRNYEKLKKCTGKCFQEEWSTSYSNYIYKDSEGKTYSIPYLRYSVDHGIRVLFIDLPDKIRGEIPSDAQERALWMNKRDAFMASNVVAAYRTGKCASGILVTGRNHLTSSSPNRTTFHSRLVSSPEIRPYFIATLDADYTPEDFIGSTKYRVQDHAWNWTNGDYQPECKMFPGYPGFDFAFLVNKSQVKDLSLEFGSFWPDDEDLGYWRDFDAGIVFRGIKGLEKGLIFN